MNLYDTLINKALGGGSGGGNYELIASKEYTIETNESYTLPTFILGTQGIRDGNKLMYVRITYKGEENVDRFIQKHTWILDFEKANNPASLSPSSVSKVAQLGVFLGSSGSLNIQTNNYGIYVNSLKTQAQNDVIDLRSYYGSGYGNITGKYLVEVFLVPFK